MAASHVIVLDSALKRTQIKVTPGRYMREVLEEACKARKLDPEAYILKTQSNKIVDLSQPFRLSGLAAGAKLQLVQGSRSATVVNVALQLPDSEGGGKLIDRFPSTTSLWLVLRKYEDAVAGQPARKLNLTQRATPSNLGSGAGRLEYEQPCLNVMGRNLETFTDLQKSLSQLGLSGSVMMRLSFKTSGGPMQEAMNEIEEYFKSSSPAASTPSLVSGAQADAPESLQSRLQESGFHTPKEHQQQIAVDTETADVAAADTDGPVGPPSTADASQPLDEQAAVAPASNTLNGISVFRPPSSGTPAAARQEEDPSIFEPDIEHAKAHQAALQQAARNTRLLSDAELAEQEAAREARLAAIRTVKVRVRYPDQSITETTVDAAESPAGLYAKISSTLAHASEPFELRFAGPKGPHQVLPNDPASRLVQNFGFRGSMLLTLVWAAEASPQARQGPSLAEAYRSRATELKVQLQAQQGENQESHRAALAKPPKGDPTSGSGGKSKADLEAKMKKFLGFGKK